MRAICVALTLAVAVAASVPAAMPAPSSGELARLSGVWTGNWGSVSGVYDPAHTLDVSFNAFGIGALDIQHSGDLAFVQCRENVPPAAAGATLLGGGLPSGGMLTCSITRGDGLKQGFVGVLGATGHRFSGTYVHFNVPGLMTSLLLTRVQPTPTPPAPVTKHAFACEGTVALLSCVDDARPNARIRVSEAFYGRSETTACPTNAMSNTACTLPTAMRVVQALCEGQRECALEASNTQFGADPCYLTSKYARVSYTCN